MQSPLDSFVGFERAPRTGAETKHATGSLTALRTGNLLRPNRDAECTLVSAEVDAPVLEGKARDKNGHADLEANYLFKCNNASALKTLRVDFFDKFKYTKKVEVQIAGPEEQSKVTLSKNNPNIKLN